MKRVGSSMHPFMSDSSNKPVGKSRIPNITWIVLLVSFTPMLLVSGLVLDQFAISHNEKLYAHLKEVVHKHTADIDTYLNERLSNINFLLNNCGIKQLTDEAFLQQKLNNLQKTYGDVFVDLGIVNEQGIQEVYAGRLKLEKAHYANAAWFAEAIGKQEYISDVFQGLRSSPHFIVSVKSSCQGRDLLLKATINFDAFNSLAENLRIGKTGFAFILNKNGEFQTKPHYDMLPVKNSYPDFIKAGKKLRHDTYVGKIKNASGNSEIIYVAELLKNNEWILVYQQEKEEAFEDLIRAQITAAVVIFIGALAIVIMNLFLLRYVIKKFDEADKEKEMMNRQMIETGKLASVGELAAGVAHEINNPVAIMVQEAGWIEDLLEEQEFAHTENLGEFKRALGELYTQGQRCKNITHKLLRFASRTSPDIEEIQVNEIIEEVVGISKMMAFAKISINIHLEKDLPEIYGSKTEVQQVLLNLINNALHALEQNGGTIEVTSQLEDSRILLAVEDDGPGIPDANLDRIFDPFYTTKEVGKGTGLGLSICFGIIEKMGGEIDVHSIMEAGTRFEVRLPLENPLIPKTGVLPILAKERTGEIVSRDEDIFDEKIKLLLVDDEERFVKILAKRFDRRNVDVTATFSGIEAIQALRKVDFDVAVLDLKLGDMDGLEVLKIFKKIYKKMEVIILSGHESEHAAREGIKYGAFAYLAKPCNFDELSDTIKKAIHVNR